MSSEIATPKLPSLPDLNRENVVDRLNGANFFGWEDFGIYTLALKGFSFGVGIKKNPHFKADCLILESSNEKWVPGQDVSVYFATGGAGTAKDPGKPDREDAYLARFLRAVYKVHRGDEYDNNAGLSQLLKCEPGLVQLYAANSLKFRLVLTPQPKDIEVKNPVTGQVIQTVKKVFRKDAFEIAA